MYEDFPLHPFNDVKPCSLSGRRATTSSSSYYDDYSSTGGVILHDLPVADSSSSYYSSAESDYHKMYHEPEAPPGYNQDHTWVNVPVSAPPAYEDPAPPPYTPYRDQATFADATAPPGYVETQPEHAGSGQDLSHEYAGSSSAHFNGVAEDRAGVLDTFNRKLSYVAGGTKLGANILKGVIKVGQYLLHKDGVYRVHFEV